MSNPLITVTTLSPEWRKANLDRTRSNCKYKCNGFITENCTRPIALGHARYGMCVNVCCEHRFINENERK